MEVYTVRCYRCLKHKGPYTRVGGKDLCQPCLDFINGELSDLDDSTDYTNQVCADCMKTFKWAGPVQAPSRCIRCATLPL